MRKILAFLIIFMCASSISYGEETHKLGKITVTPSRLQSPFDINARSMTVLDESAIQLSSYTALSDIIGNIGDIDLRRRGPEGVQSDINIRGATFEQNSILIDGIKMNDPQTGHFNMDLALTSCDVERVEILKGPASSIYGPNSFGGVINIITKRPEGPKILAEARGGSFDYFNSLLSVSVPVGILANRFSIEESRSGGYIPETEFNILSLSDKASFDIGPGKVDFLFGYTKKDFGADSFYSNLFSNEEERTDTRIFNLIGDMEFGDLHLKPMLFLRRHWDKFILDRNRPGWQTNYSTNYNYGFELNCVLVNAFMDTSYGLELSRDTIDSTNLQKHFRTRQAVYLELSPHICDKFDLKVALREDWFSDFGLEFSPSINASYKVTEQISFRALIGRSYRIPTFTDLYYSDSANAGNPSLGTESAWTYEAGADFKIGPLTNSVTYFYRNSYDTIDWTRPLSSSRWQATNIGSVDTNGAEVSLSLVPIKIFPECTINRTFFSYTVLDLFRKHDYLSKYALDYLKQHITAGTEIDIFRFSNSWVANYKKRVNVGSALIVDAKLTKDIFKKKSLGLSVFIEATNLFDADYTEQSGVPMPGRWLKSGAKFEF